MDVCPIEKQNKKKIHIQASLRRYYVIYAFVGALIPAPKPPTTQRLMRRFPIARVI